MSSELKLTQLLSQLTKLTSKGKLDWSAKEAPDSLARGTDDLFPLYFETAYKDQYIAIAQRRYRSYDGEYERFYWNEDIVLAFLDARDRVIWQDSSQSAALSNLFNTVREQVADVDGILKRLLDDDDTAA